MSKPLVLIAGGGIGGLATALTLHEIGVPCRIFESVHHLRPLGVGINLQPNAIRELYDMGLDDAALLDVGVQCREWALVGLNGNEIYAEPRGIEAGYRWPQYSVHRGRFHMLLYAKLIERLGRDAFYPGHRVSGYVQGASGVTALVETEAGERTFEGTLLIGADGIHSATRAQMHPTQPPIHWGGAIMWRGTSPGVPFRTGASFIGLGTGRHRVVVYPISRPDPDSGLATLNWIAELTVDNSEGWSKGDWTATVSPEDVVPHFADWDYGWLNVPQLIATASDTINEYPMIDRDPIPTWRDGRVALLGDAAHPMYPTGSNGATQAIIDARVLGSTILEHGVTPAALEAYDERLCEEISAVVLRNRGAGPFGILKLVDEKCSGVFDDINDVLPRAQLAEFMSGYKQAAGYAIESLNAAPPIIPRGKQVRA